MASNPLAYTWSNNSSNSLQNPSLGNMEMPYYPEIPPWFVIAFAGINGGGFCLNFLSIWLLATRTLIYKYKANWFLVSLCFSDMLVALSCFYFLATVTAQNMSDFSKRVSTLIFGFALETSIMSLVCLTYDRLTAIRQPFRYKEIMSRAHVTVIMIFGWLFCVALTAIQFVFAFIHRHERYIFINWIVFISLSVIAISFLIMVYLYLIYEIRRHASHIKSTAVCSAHPRNSLLIFDPKDDKSNVHLSPEDQLELSYMAPPRYADGGARLSCTATSSLLSYGYSSSSSRKDSYQTPRPSLKSAGESLNTLGIPEEKLQELRLLKHRREQATKKHSQQILVRKERQSLLLCLCIVITFISCWTPVVTLFVRCLWRGTCQRDDHLLYIALCLVSFNSLLDPILYFIIKREFRDFIQKSLCKRPSSQPRRRTSSGEMGDRRRKVSTIQRRPEVLVTKD